MEPGRYAAAMYSSKCSEACCNHKTLTATFARANNKLLGFLVEKYIAKTRKEDKRHNEKLRCEKKTSQNQ